VTEADDRAGHPIIALPGRSRSHAGRRLVAAFRTFAGVLSSGSGAEPPRRTRVQGWATFQQLVTTPTVKEHPGQQLAEQPDLRALDSSIGEAKSATERRFYACWPWNRVDYIT